LLNESGKVVTFPNVAFSMKVDQPRSNYFMDTLQIQIGDLKDKVERLYELVERISLQVQGLSDNKQTMSNPESYSLSAFARRKSVFPSESALESQLTHKDILVDDNSSTSSNPSNNESNPNISPDIQIRRLTAQLTAAYNRIAALEEQLLTYRIKS
jgi:hypothetical protein